MLLRRIKYFQSVVESGSFTEAAEACYISQSAMSQQIRALEDELGVPLFVRQNRKVTLTEAGEYFYAKTVVLMAELDRLCRDTARVGRRDTARLAVGYLKSYGGGEFRLALADFASKYPSVELTLLEGCHEELYDALRFGRVDLVLNDQRRAFSDEYVNCELAQRRSYIELSGHSPLSRLRELDVSDLKHVTCILVASKGQEETEQTYYRDIIGMNGDFIFAESLSQARTMAAAGRGILPIEGAPEAESDGLCRIPLTRQGKPLSTRLCAFWKEDNSGFYVEEFAAMLKARFEDPSTDP